MDSFPSMPYYVPWSPDTPPDNPSPMDDEFNGMSLNPKWTTVISSASLATLSMSNAMNNGKGGSRVIVGTKVGAVNLKRHYDLWQSAPSGLWRFRAKLALESHGARYFGCGLGVRNSGTNVVLDTRVWYHDTFGYLSVAYTKTTGETSNTETNLGQFRHQNFYIEIEKTDSDTIVWRISTNGEEGSFSQTASRAIVANMTSLDQVGVVFMTWANEGFPALSSCDWFRRMA